jgi:hypothetical protein
MAEQHYSFYPPESLIMTTYHHSPVTGKKEICSAPPGKCKYKEVTSFDTYIANQEEKLVDITEFADRTLPDHTEDEMDGWWDNIRKHHKTIAVKGWEFALGEKGKDARYCLTCKTSLPLGTGLGKKGREEINCPSCGVKCYDTLTGVAIDYEAQQFFDPERVRKARWYHTSSYPKWDEVVANTDNPDALFVHLGTLDAALDRSDHLSRGDFVPDHVYLYEIQLNEDIHISEYIHEEDGFVDQPEKISDTIEEGGETYSMTGATRYVNHYESPGSISLLVHPHAFKVLMKQEITP